MLHPPASAGVVVTGRRADTRKLPLESLHERHTGLTPSLAGAFFEAASVCLNRHHDSPVEMEIAMVNRTVVVRAIRNSENKLTFLDIELAD